ncbi:MAG: alpha/beta hydrolase [Hyphomicrobiales bacterium]|nr:MAG: alpha/beta hydrolase [Hyphomicrobiales bacterium]
MTKFFEGPDGRRLAYQDTGGIGPVVLCLAGLTRNARDFAGLAAHLAAHYRVLRIDSRGRGLSEWADDPVAEYTVPIEAGDALALLDHLEIPRAAIIGTSRGGILGVILGATASARMNCLVLNDVGPVIEPQGLAGIVGFLGIEPRADTFEAAAEGLERAMGAAFPDLSAKQWLGFARTIYRDDGGRPRLSYDPRLRQAVEVAMKAAKQAGQPDLWGFFDALTGLPILAIRGANSDILSAETLAEMARRRPDMAHVTVANRGHAPFLDEPEALTAIDTFLERHAT